MPTVKLRIRLEAGSRIQAGGFDSFVLITGATLLENNEASAELTLISLPLQMAECLCRAVSIANHVKARHLLIERAVT